MNKIPKWLKAGFLLVLVFVIGYIWGMFNRPAPPAPADPVVIIDPTPKEKTKTVYVYAQRIDGHTQTHIDLPPEGPQPGDVYRSPTAGEVHTTVTDERTEDVIAETTREVTGETVATFTETGLDLDTTFNFSQEIAVNIPNLRPGCGGRVGGYGWDKRRLVCWRLGGRRKIGIVEIAGWRDCPLMEGRLESRMMV